MVNVELSLLSLLSFLILMISLKFSYDFIPVINVSNDNFPDVFTIETKSGRIRGKLNETLFDKKHYYSFRGIPYGKPPIGELRFKAPVKAEPWTGAFDAFEYGDSCLQQRYQNVAESEGTEDCLKLHIFVPAQSLMNNESLAVLFVITGGRFVWDLTRNSRPDFFIDENVIIVLAQHRVGPFGFLSLGLPEYSGNMGLKDQLLALEWVNQNIASFGGDKNRITFFGRSSGSMSASLHILNPKSRKLFQRAILLSGSAMNPVLPRVKNHTSIIQNLADAMYYPISNEDDLIEFLKQVDGEFLSKSTYRAGYYPGLGRKGLTRLWNVIVEEENAIDPVLTKPPIEITLANHNQNEIDGLFLYTSREFTFEQEYLNPKLLENFDKQFEITFPLTTPDFRSEEYKVAAGKIREFYFNGKPVEYDTLANLNQLMSDIKFVYGINLNARIQAAQSSGRTYVTRFSVENEWNPSAILHKLSGGKITYYDHSDTTYYIFRENPNMIEFPDSLYTELTGNSKPYQVIKNMTKFFADFIKYGNPMSNHEPIQFKSKDSDQYNYFDITSQGIFVKPDLFKRQMDFWDEILSINQTYDKSHFL